MTKVLIADDSIAVRKVAERLLTEAGFGVTLAANGAEALAHLAKETPDLIVSDVIMPDKSGYEVCAFVRGQKAIANTPVLLISGIVNDEVTKQAESCHADGVLKKPFQGTSLKDRVIELLAKRQSPAAPVAKSPEKVPASNEPIQSARVSDEQLATYQRAAARLKALEEELLVERDRATRSAQRVVQLEGEAGRAQELESMLAKEREQTTQLKMQLAEADSAAKRVQELEMALQKERDKSAQQATSLAELQATLQAERQAAAQLVEQMTEMEQAVTRSQDLAQQLAQEQERTNDLTRRVAESEELTARVRTLEGLLSTEQQRSKDLAERLSETERVSHKGSESDALLQTERERNGLLVKRVSDAEQEAEQANKRFAEMAIKLGEIAGLASQLGNGKRRS